MRVFLPLLALWVPYIVGFAWTNGHKALVAAASNVDKPSDLLQNHRLPNIYAVALSELQELESEPLCHRVAARLLVNNCQLVDGKDEATILTDSGRQVRDFVDSYAASLAICDLERGSFAIPTACAKFREVSLSQVVIRGEAQLHVSPAEIGLCLSALAASDAAWSTWVSYRHKALRFCEAARVDNEKAQNILLYQRLTRVLTRLTDGVEAELQKRMDDLDQRARQSLEKLEQIAPHIDRLSEGLGHVETYLSDDLELALKKSSESVRGGIQHAENLQQLLGVLIAHVLESNSQLAFAHEQALQHATQQASNDMGVLIAVVSTAVASSSALQQQIQLSNQQATALAQRQDTLEHGLDRLAVATETLTTKLADHSSILKQAGNITNDILDALEETAAAAAAVNKSFFLSATTRSWWPFVVFPPASLIMGSYGLRPSILRNLGLLVLGEVVAFVVSSYDRLTTQVWGVFEGVAANATAPAL